MVNQSQLNSLKFKNKCKRAFDIAVAVPSIMIATPIIAFTAAALCLETKEAPFFKQVRIGQNGRPFYIYKIRTMNSNVDRDGETLPDIERTGSLGIKVRKSRLDELPQLWNVLKGDMSLVGPRPHTVNIGFASNRDRCAVKPGLTGLGKVKGLKNLSDSAELQYDLTYKHKYETSSLGQMLLEDIKIILRTPVAVVKYRSAPHSRQLRNI